MVRRRAHLQEGGPEREEQDGVAEKAGEAVQESKEGGEAACRDESRGAPFVGSAEGEPREAAPSHRCECSQAEHVGCV